MDYSIKTLLRKGESHSLHCEDDFTYFEYKDWVFIAVFDGCSGGTKSYFASTLFTKLMLTEFQAYTKFLYDYNTTSSIANSLIESFKLKLKETCQFLHLNENEILSTIVLVVADIKRNDAHGIIIGDGSIFHNGTEILRVDPIDNAPDYISYHLQNNFFKIKHEIKFSNYNDISITSDGIDQLKRNGHFLSDEDKKKILDFLLIDRKFENLDVMLSRKFNILENKENIYPSDDLSIVRLILQNDVSQSIIEL